MSHARADKEAYVLPLAWELDRRGISYWLDEAEISWGEKISLKINEGLRQSRFVVVFLTSAFVGRNWTETELSAAITRENDEGRIVVLPIVAGDPHEILASYPLLRDRAYLQWDMGIEAVVSNLQNRLFAAEPKPKIPVSVRGTLHSVLISPDLLVQTLSELETHSLYSPSLLAADLRKAGFLADAIDDQQLVLNGHLVNPTTPDWGEPGIWSLDLAQTVFEIVTGAQPTLLSRGRGFRYRELLDQLRLVLSRRTQ